MKPETDKRSTKAGAKRSWRRKWLTLYAPLFIWIIVVLGLGSGLGSMNETSRIIRPLLEFLFPSAAPETLQQYHGFIRKAAHFVEYAVLGFLASRAFASRKNWRIAAAVLVVAVAAHDELFQSVNPARTGSKWDVVLDIFGGATAIVLYWVWRSRRRIKREQARLAH